MIKNSKKSSAINICADEDLHNNSYYSEADTIPHLNKYQSFLDLKDNLNLIQKLTPSELFCNTKERKKIYISHIKNIEFDYSLQPINNQTMQNFCKMAEDIKLDQSIDELFSGKKVNTGEDRPALHTALRADRNEYVIVNNRNIIPEIFNSRDQILNIAERIRQNKWFKDTNKKVTDIVNVGIGGSELGPKMAIYALKEYQNTRIKRHFLSNNDPKYIENLLKKINLKSTIFIINSKSFTTNETITNLEIILKLFDDSLPAFEHIIAVTSNISLASKYNIQHILPIWDWVGGRFSFCSAVNLILAIMIGPKNFLKILHGARLMDQHFRNTPYHTNIPILSALLEMWNINFFKSKSHLLLTYIHFLKYLPDFLQQLEMESNGKSTNLNNSLISYATSPITWGGLGSHAEHAYYQLLAQGSHFNMIDYFFDKESGFDTINQIAYQKIQALAQGIGSPDLKHFRLGVNVITLNKLCPESLGSLIAMYEHKIYCQSVLWNINAFDQPGVAAIKNSYK